MRKKYYKGRCTKRYVAKCTDVCRTYDPLQTAYNMIANRPQTSFKISCMKAVTECRSKAKSRQEFVSLMKQKGWDVVWTESRKNITFVNANGKRIRDKTIAKELNTRIDKEALTDEFERNRLNGYRNESNRIAGRNGQEGNGISVGTATNSAGAASQYESAESVGASEWIAQGGIGTIVSEILGAGRQIEQAVNGDAQATGRGDATDPTVMAKYRERKQDTEDESEEQYYGIQM